MCIIMHRAIGSQRTLRKNDEIDVLNNKPWYYLQKRAFSMHTEWSPNSPCFSKKHKEWSQTIVRLFPRLKNHIPAVDKTTRVQSSLTL